MNGTRLGTERRERKGRGFEGLQYLELTRWGEGSVNVHISDLGEGVVAGLTYLQMYEEEHNTKVLEDFSMGNISFEGPVASTVHVACCSLLNGVDERVTQSHSLEQNEKLSVTARASCCPSAPLRPIFLSFQPETNRSGPLVWPS